jgi:hypothetical protein
MTLTNRKKAEFRQGIRSEMPRSLCLFA